MRLFFVLLVLFSFCPSAFAGDFLIKDQNSVTTKEWRSLTEAEKKAFLNPGQEIPVDVFLVDAFRENFFCLSGTEKWEKVLVYDGTYIQRKTETGERIGVKIIAVPVFLFILAMFTMMLSNFSKNYSALMAIFSFMLVSIASLRAMMYSPHLFLLLFLINCSAVVIIFLSAMFGNSNLAYKVTSGFFYLMSAVVLFAY